MLHTGGGDDRVDLRGSTGALTLDLGDGADRLTLGSLAPALGGNPRAIAGALDLSGGAGADALTLDASAETADLSGRIDATTSSGLGLGDTLTYAGFEGLEVLLGSGADELEIADVGAALTSVETGAGDDRVTITASAADGWLAVNAGSGDDEIDASAARLAVILLGGDGNDRLTGGQGADILLGDAGALTWRDADGRLLGRVGIDVDERRLLLPGDRENSLRDVPASQDLSGWVGLEISTRTGADGDDQLIGADGDASCGHGGNDWLGMGRHRPAVRAGADDILIGRGPHPPRSGRRQRLPPRGRDPCPGHRRRRPPLRRQWPRPAPRRSRPDHLRHPRPGQRAQRARRRRRRRRRARRRYGQGRAHRRRRQ